MKGANVLSGKLAQQKYEKDVIGILQNKELPDFYQTKDPQIRTGWLSLPLSNKALEFCADVGHAAHPLPGEARAIAGKKQTDALLIKLASKKDFGSHSFLPRRYEEDEVREARSKTFKGMMRDVASGKFDEEQAKKKKKEGRGAGGEEEDQLFKEERAYVDEMKKLTARVVKWNEYDY